MRRRSARSPRRGAALHQAGRAQGQLQGEAHGGHRRLRASKMPAPPDRCVRYWPPTVNDAHHFPCISQIRRIKYPLKSRHPLTPGSRIRGMHRNCDTTRVARAVSWREAVSCGVVGGRSRCRTRRRTRCRRKGSWRRRRRLGDCAPLLLALGCVTPSQIPAEFAHLADSWKWQRAAAAHTQLAVARWEK